MSFFDLIGIDKKLISALFLIKIGCGILLSWIYTAYYTDRSTADIFKYFDDSKVMYEALFNKPADFFQMLIGFQNDNTYFNEQYYTHMKHWFRPFASNYYNDTHLIIRFNAFVRLFSFGYFNVHTVFMNFLSLSGIIAFYKTFTNIASLSFKWFLGGISLLPSLLFWGSGVLKEGLLLFAIGFFCHAFFLLIHHRFRPVQLIVCVLMAYLLVRLKFYVLVALIPPLIAYAWALKGPQKKVLPKYIVTLLLLMGIALNLKWLSPDLDPLALMAQKQRDFMCLAEYMNSGSRIEMSKMDPSTAGFFKMLPEGLINGFFRPFIWESNTAFMLINALENTLLLLSLFLSIVFFRKKISINWNLLFFALSFIFILNSIIGMSTPVLGALVRYKLPTLPFYMLIISLIIDPLKLKKLVAP